MKFEDIQLTGYRRENGRVGVRNHVLILSVDDISNAAVEGVARLIRGTMALPHPYGRLQFGEDLDLTFRTLIGAGRNPNVAAVVVIGIEPNWTDFIVQGIAETGKPVTGFSIERSGDLKTIETAAQEKADSVYKETYEKAINEAKQKAVEIKEQAKNEAETEAQIFIKNSETLKKELTASAEQNFGEAVERVLQQLLT